MFPWPIFGLCRVVVQHIGHIVPVVCGVAEVGTNLTVSLMSVTMAADALGGIGPKTHQLRHGCGEAAHDGMATRTSGILRTAVVIRICLVPFGLAEITRTATFGAGD